MSAPVLEYASKSVNLTATGNIATGNGVLIGVCANSSTAGTVVFRDGGASGTVLNGALALTAGTFVRFPVRFTGGLHVTIAGTLDATFFIVEGQG
jgi:hypothetical protein